MASIPADGIALVGLSHICWRSDCHQPWGEEWMPSPSLSAPWLWLCQMTAPCVGVCVCQCQNNNHCWDSDTSSHIILQLCRCKHSSVDCQGRGDFRAIILSTRGNLFKTEGSKWDEFDPGRSRASTLRCWTKTEAKNKLDAAGGHQRQRQRPEQDELDATD